MVFVGRSEDKCKTLLAEIVAAGNVRCSYLVGDLSVQADVRAMAAGFLARHDRLDLLLNNAGAWFTERRETVEGFEQTWALNHLAYFLLTHLLLDTLKASAPARIVSVSSAAHREGKMDWEDLQYNRSYPRAGFGAYSRSKLANIQFTLALSRRLAGTGVTATCVHPGYVRTGFGVNNGPLTRFVLWLSSPFARTPEKGAQVLIHMALSPEVEGLTGQYWANNKEKASSALAQDREAQEKLWQLSLEMTGREG